MADASLGAIKQALINKVYDVFSETHGLDMNIYPHSVEQGANMPAFFISSVSTDQEELMYERARKINKFQIVYMTESPEELEDVIERLNYNLVYIMLDDGLLRASKKKANIVDQTVIFLVNFDFIGKRSKVYETLMETLDVMQEVKGE